MNQSLADVTYRRHVLATLGCGLMDRITESFLTDFVNEQEFSELAQDTQFEHFASYVTVRRHYNGARIDTSDIVVGSGGDTGIDGIAILVNGSLVTDIENLKEHADLSGNFDVIFVFIQAERSASFDGSKIGTFGFGVRDFSEEKLKLVRNDKVKKAAEVMAQLYKRGTQFRPGNPACRLYYTTTGNWTHDVNLEARRKSVVEDLSSIQIFRDVEFACIGADGIQGLYRQTKNAITREFTFASRTLIPDIYGVNEAYLGFIPVSEFLSIVRDDSGDLVHSIFYDNVRDWQDYNAVNRTLRTMRRDRFQIEDFQIVNGCQTSHVLFDQRDTVDDSVAIPLRLIATQDDNIINAIIRAIKRQTKVKRSSFSLSQILLNS
jgi:AIPR protein